MVGPLLPWVLHPILNPVLKISICSHICIIAPQRVQSSLCWGSRISFSKPGHFNMEMQKCSGKLNEEWMSVVRRRWRVRGRGRGRWRGRRCKFLDWAVGAILPPRPSVKLHSGWPPASLRVQVNEIFGPIERFQHAPQLTPFNQPLFWCSKVGIHYDTDKYHPNDTNRASVSRQLMERWMKCIWLTSRKAPLFLRKRRKHLNNEKLHLHIFLVHSHQVSTVSQVINHSSFKHFMAVRDGRATSVESRTSMSHNLAGDSWLLGGRLDWQLKYIIRLIKHNAAFHTYLWCHRLS